MRAPATAGTVRGHGKEKGKFSMHDDSSITITTARPRSGVLILSGYGIRVAVERGHLVVEDGRGRDRRQGRFPRTIRDLKRLVVIGHTGTVSLDALRWLHDRGCAFVQMDSDGKVIVASGPQGLDDARLRRAQALAIENDSGMTIARDLLSRKLDGQADVLDTLDGGHIAARAVRTFRDELAQATTAEQFRIWESQAARIYWDAWAALPIRFARKAATRMPDHWQTVGSRSSPLTGSPRTAANPANAILNYLYAIAEAECRIALLAVGLDPGLGIVHADQRNRDSFACDVMEVIRPNVDAFVLELLQSRPFGTGDFFETRQGACRLLPPVTRILAETAPRWASVLAPIVEGIAQTLLDKSEKARSTTARRRVPTPLTQANRSAGRPKVRKHRDQDAHPRRTSPRLARLPAACLDCGVILEDAARKYCDDCLPEVRQEQTNAFAVAGPATLATRRAAGTDPAHGGEAGKSRGRSNATHQAAVATWERAEGEKSEPEHFTRDILPMLQNVSLSKMAKATGLTEGYCSFVRRGLKIPHRRHWEAFAKLGNNREEWGMHVSD